MQRYAMFLAVCTCCFLPAFTLAQTPQQKADPPATGDNGKKAPAKKAETLEQLIGEAFKNNPDIRVAQTKLRLAEAEADRTRIKLISEITSLHADIEAAEAGLMEGKERYARAQTLFKSGAISREDLSAALLTYVKLKADLASLQAKLPYLLGRPNAKASAEFRRSTLLEAAAGARTDEEFLRRMMLDFDGRLPTPEEMKKFLAMPDKDRREKWIDQRLSTNQDRVAVFFEINDVEPLFDYRVKLWQHFKAPETPLTEKLRKALDASTRLDADTIAAKEALEFVREKALPGINLVVRAKPGKDEVTIRLKEPVPVGAMLQFLEDELGVVFVMRDYGVVVVPADDRLPPGAIRVVDFWKQGAPSKSK